MLELCNYYIVKYSQVFIHTSNINSSCAKTVLISGANYIRFSFYDVTKDTHVKLKFLSLSTHHINGFISRQHTAACAVKHITSDVGRQLDSS